MRAKRARALKGATRSESRANRRAARRAVPFQTCVEPSTRDWQNAAWKHRGDVHRASKAELREMRDLREAEP